MKGLSIMQILLLVVLTMVSTALGCSAEPQADPPEHSQRSTAAALPSAAQGDTIDQLIAELRNVSGSFTRQGAGHDYRFDGSLDVVRALAEHGDSAVSRLVECMDREDPTQATLNGRSVPLGALCFDALRRIAYYEATDDQGDIDGKWPGYITVAAEREARLEAQAAWREVVANRLYRMP